MMMAQQIDRKQLKREMKELLREMNAAKEQIYGRTIKGEVEAKIAQLQ